MLYIISYDISIDKRRAKIAKLLEGFGQRVQYSVFECNLDDRECAVLMRKLQRLAKPAESDSIRIYRLCSPCVKKVEIIGAGPPVETRANVYIV